MRIVVCLLAVLFVGPAHSLEWDIGRIGDEPYLIGCSGTPRRILIYLHAWSSDYAAAVTRLGTRGLLDHATDTCIVSPNFNGPAGTRKACASDDALRRIESVISDVKGKTKIEAVDMFGASGGGMVALAFLSEYPGIVRRASIWVPIYRMARWFFSGANERERRDMVGCFGRPPDDDHDPEYVARSPAGRMSKLKGPVEITINLGMRDTEVPPAEQGEIAARRIMDECPDCRLSVVRWPQMDHDFDGARAMSVDLAP